MAKQPLLSLIRNKAVTSFQSEVNEEDQIIRAGRRTFQFHAYHPRNVADESEERERKRDEDEFSSPGERV